MTVLALNRLAPVATADLIQRIIGNKGLPEDVVKEIVSRTDGVPLFVEELTNAAIEAETAQAAREAVATVPSAAQPIPATLHASLMARLDQLGPARDVARIAAAIGREFSYELLAAVANKTEFELTTALDRLISAGLLFREGTPPHATYLFKHALIRDAAYGMLLRQSRWDLHSRIGKNLENLFPHAAEVQPELLAHHFTEGGVPDKAVEYWLKAGRQAVVRATMTEALSHLDKGFSLLSPMPDSTWRRQIELALQIARASALIATLGAAAPVVGEAYERARQLWEIAGRPSHFEPMLPLFWHHFNRGQLETAHQIASELAITGEARNDAALTFVGTSYLAYTCLDRAEFAECRVHSENCLRIYDPIPVSKRLLYNGRASALTVLSHALYCLGYPDQSRIRMNEGLSEVREVSNPPYALAGVLMHPRASQPPAQQAVSGQHR